MRAFGLIGLVLALVIAGVLVKKQLSVVTAAPVVPGVAAPGTAPAGAGDPAQQVQQVQQQVRDALDAAAKAHRMPDDN